MKSQLLSALGICLLGLGLATAAQASLVDQGGGMIYDTDLDITWLSDANYAMTSGYDADGMMNWVDANAWAEQLSYGGYDDWRLPFLPQFDSTCDNSRDVDGLTYDFGFGCIGGEYGHLFYEELGATAGNPITDSTAPELALFVNMQTEGLGDYWASNDFSVSYLDNHFHFSDGYQRYFDSSAEMYAMAVRDGDVNVVPVPAAVWLFGSGLIGLIGVAKRKKA